MDEWHYGNMKLVQGLGAERKARSRIQVEAHEQMVER